MKIYENANDQHVRKVVIYEVSAGLAFDEAGTELLTKEQIVDAFLKGCVVKNEGNYKIPTGVNVTDSGAELVFGGGGSGGPEVENAIATHGMGWTESEPKEGFDITWDGDTTGLDVALDVYYKVSDVPLTVEELTGAIGYIIVDNDEFSAEAISTELAPSIIIIQGGIEDETAAYQFGLSVLSDTYIEDVLITKGLYLYEPTENIYTSRLYKEASTEEVVHQIDEKYIPQGSFVIDYSDPKSDDYEKAIEFFDANRPVYLSKDSSKIPMTGYNSTHCFFGGTVSAYLPGGYVICVYAHIGPEGTNYFWYQYNSPVEVPASAMVVEFKAITESGPFECNHTIDEVKEALKTGNVVGVYFTGDTDSGLPLGNATAYCSGDIGFYFQGVDIDSGVPTYLFTSDSDSGAVLEKFGEWGFTGF